MPFKNPPELYQTWTHMWQRCLNPNDTNYQYYGGRGIKVCDRWKHFANFAADMGERPIGTTLDRINNDGDYELANCQWATKTKQMFNRRKPRHNTSGTAGVGFHKATGKWRAYIGQKSLGYFNSIEDAIKARKKGELVYGQHAI